MRLRNLGLAAAVASAGLYQTQRGRRPSQGRRRAARLGGPRAAHHRARSRSRRAAGSPPPASRAGPRSGIATPTCRSACGARVSSRSPARSRTRRSPRPRRASSSRSTSPMLAPGAQAADFELVANELSPQRRRPQHRLRAARGRRARARRHDRLRVQERPARDGELDRAAERRGRRARAAARADARRVAARRPGSPPTASAVAVQTAATLAPAERADRPDRPPARSATRPTSRTALAEQVAVEATSGARPLGRVDRRRRRRPDRPPLAAPLRDRQGAVRRAGSATRAARARREPASLAHAQRRRHRDDRPRVDGTVTWTGTAAVDRRRPGPPAPSSAITDQGGHRRHRAADARRRRHGHVEHGRDRARRTRSSTRSSTRTSPSSSRSTRLNPDLAWLDSQLPVTVNESGSCNAYSTGDDIHFFPRERAVREHRPDGGRRLSRVRPLAARTTRSSTASATFDGALSEGVADMLAVADHAATTAWAAASSSTTTPLRELDPAGTEKKWPDDMTGEVHDDGEIIGGTLWDLRVALEAKLGADGRLREDARHLLRRSSSARRTSRRRYAEALLADDDDGDLANGTPNQCEINAAFGAHGLADPTVTLGITAPDARRLQRSR